jgi:hypothetical protein
MTRRAVGRFRYGVLVEAGLNGTCGPAGGFDPAEWLGDGFRLMVRELARTVIVTVALPVSVGT